jgi:serine/threonine-protein kinase ULK4
VKPIIGNKDIEKAAAELVFNAA